MSKKLLIEGWRGINHSYAMVNQYQLLALREQSLQIFHNDLPFVSPEWNLKKNFCGFDEKALSYLASIPGLAKEEQADIVYRISYPYRLRPSKAKKLYVFGTSEAQIITPDMIFGDGLKENKDPDLKIITPSHWSKIGFLKAGFDEENIKVISHGVDTSIFKPLESEIREQYRSLLGANNDTFLILSLGSMQKNKGVDVLLTAYIQLKSKYPQVKLVLKDQSNLYGITANEIVNLYCKERGINPSAGEIQTALAGIFCITKNLNLQELNGLYGAADCYVSPYRAEGFNLPPLEAAAAGTPIIVTKGGSTDDYADPSFALQIESQIKTADGRTYLEPDSDSLIEELQNLIMKKNDLINREIAINFIDKEFSWDVACKKLMALINIA
jgi:glycosyltransferase involved in cell wall biosynthesis